MALCGGEYGGVHDAGNWAQSLFYMRRHGERHLLRRNSKIFAPVSEKQLGERIFDRIYRIEEMRRACIRSFGCRCSRDWQSRSVSERINRQDADILPFAESATADDSLLHPSPFTLHPSPFTLHPSPFTLHPSPFISPAGCNRSLGTHRRRPLKL
jgi:hypothetical protein